MKANQHTHLTPLTSRSRTFFRNCGFAAAVCLGTALAQAQTTDTWNGGGTDANWMTAGNWSAGAPNPGDSLVFGGNVQTSPNNNFPVDTLFGGILFARTASPFTLGGNEITLSGLVENDATNQLQTISLPLVLSGAVTFNTASNDLTGGVSDDIFVGGNVSGTGSLVKIGAGNLFLTNGLYTYSSGTTVSNGLVDINTGGTFTMSGGALLLDVRSYALGLTINFTADSSVGVSLLDNAEPRGVDTYSTIGTAGFKFTKIGAGILRMGGGINASSIDVAEGTLASLGGAALSQTHLGTSTITVENGAMLRADDGGICPNAIILNGGNGTSLGSYTQEGVLVSGSRNNTSPTNNIFTNTITLAADSTLGSLWGNMIISGNLMGPGSLVKSGPNPLILSGSNSFAGTLTINTGTLQAGSSNALPSGVSVTINTASTLDLDGNPAIVSSLADDGQALAALDNTSTNPAALTITSSANFTGKVQNSGGGPLSIINVSGSTALTGVNNYTGATMVEGGSLDMILPTATTTGGLFLATNNASVSVHFSTPGSSLQASAATLGSSSADMTTLTIDLNGYGNVAKPVINATNGTGVLTANGTINVTINNPANITVGSIHLIKYTSLTGSGTSFTLNPIAGVTATIVTNAANKSIDLSISQAPITTWTARISTNWDYVTTNWVFAGVKTNYQDNEAVFFDDTASNFLVNLTTTLTPGSVLLNATNTYLFTGPGSLSGGTLTKNGAGTLILDVAGSTYNSTTISAGTLQVGNNDSSGDLGAGSVNDQGTLSFNLTNNYTVLGAISGAGAVVQNNTNTLTLSQANTYAGGTVVSQGIVKQANNLSLGTPAGSLLVTVSNGASLDLGGKLAGLGYVSINGNGVNANTGVLETSAGMNCDIGCSPVGVKYLRLAGNASIGDNTGDFQLGTNSNANGGAGVCAIDGQGFSLTKIGNNNLIVEGTNLTALSQFTLASGGLIFCNSARTPFGTACTIVISNNAWMDSWDNYANSGITVANNVVIGPGNGQLRNTRTLYYGHAGYNTYSGAITLNSDLMVMNTATYGGPPGNVATSGTMTFSGPISGPGGINCTNGNPYTAGGATSLNTETLSGVNTYTGATVVNQGLLQLSSVQQGGGTYLVYDNSTLDVPAQNGYTTVPMASLMLGASTGGTLSLSRLASLSTVNPLITATNLSVLGNNILLLPPIAYATAPGEYPLIRYTTPPSGYGTLGQITVGGGVRGVPGYVTNDTANSEIAFVVSGGTPVVWTGSANNSWDINNSTDWVTDLIATTYQQTGSLGDAVTFDDSSSVTNVNIPAPVAPTVAIFNLTNENYMLFGTNITGAASLVKNGPGTLVLSNFNNNFTSGTIINGGTLRTATAFPAAALNNLTGTVTINSGATLDMGSNNLQTLVINASGSGVGGNGAIQANYSGGGQAWGVSIVNQTGNLAIGGNNRWDVRNGSKQWNVSTNGLTLTKLGAGYTALNGVAVSTNLGDITILAGTLSYQAATKGLGNPNNTIWVGASGALDFNAATVPLVKNIVITNGGAIQIDGGNTLGQNVIAGPVNLVSGTAHINGNYFNGLYVSNTISGAGGLSLQYQTYLYLAASNTFTGQLTVPYSGGANGGLGTRLSLIGNGSVSHASLIYMLGIVSGQPYPGFIDVNGRVDGTLTLGTNQTLRGDNGSFVRGSVVAAAGSAIAPGGINNSNYQSMSVSNSLTFQAGSTNFMDIYKAGTLLTNDLIAVSNLVTYGGTLQLQTNGPTALAVNDSFQLFRAGSSAANFAAIVDNSGTTWSFNPATGVATVTGLPPTVNTNPATANFMATVSSGALSFSWAPDHQGWQLYTNSVGLTATSSWFPLSGSATVTNEALTINPTNPNVFFQLRYP